MSMKTASIPTGIVIATGIVAGTEQGPPVIRKVSGQRKYTN